ncbi:ATP/GTP-binding protein [Streptomyces sp. NEAU-S7GS2]|uniref:ATP/GTP-binding protein n=1 Tax=Streptomyces sp. NEAU-S7GS2 TaxID=2202000 RepID=UPI000D6EED76|nr:ATP/GTP-binding protein [Streptomyces sp. NEAU-S7GS2]AWN24796.1 ATP/GTP-binding protein [Streptomyces sp. NEAU-S7GS2]
MSTHTSSAVSGLWDLTSGLVTGILRLLGWISSHLILLCLLGVIGLAVFEVVRTRLADKASRKRVAFRLTPNKTFEPDAEQIWRYATLLTRASTSGPWWTPLRSRSTRLRMTADGHHPLDFSVEAPASAAHLLATSPYRGVKITRTAPVRTVAKAQHTVRAEFVLRGSPAKSLRAVPLDPDPLQPLVDALAAVRADLGDRAELCLDVQRIPVWQLWMRRWRLLADARRKALRHARQDQNATADVEDGWRSVLANLFAGDDKRTRSRLSVPARPRPLDRAKVLGKLQDPSGLLRIQILVRCTSNQTGNADKRLGHISAALDVFAGGTRLVHTGQRLGPLRIGPDHRFFRKAFDRRWISGQIKGHPSWVRADEIAGLLKPPTMHCVLPVLPSEAPTYVPGSSKAAGLMVQGWHTAPNGKDRLIASPLDETLFTLRVGRSNFGKTEQALCQIVGLAHAGVGGMYIDPHGDAMRAAARYLAHEPIMQRLWFLDLTGRLGEKAPMGTWNPLSLERGQRPDEVVRAVTDAIAGTLGWNDSTHPRALTVLTKSVEALIAVNAAAVAAGAPERQATLFQIRALLTDASWRGQVLAVLDAKAADWWRSTFPTFPPDAVAPVTNPLERLYANPVTRALLGSPTSTFDFREAMDSGRLVWICPSASGPTDRLLLSILFADFFRAGLSRRNLPETERRPFHAFVDELISIDSSSSSVIAQVSEELRKFGVRLHAMSQLLQRVSASTRESLMQNASAISSTAGSIEAVSIVAKEWSGAVDPAEIADLPRFHHYVTFTAGGRRIGPLLIRGPRLGELYDELARPGKVRELRASADANVAARPQGELCTAAEGHDQLVSAFLKLRKRPVRASVAAKEASDAPGPDVSGAGHNEERDDYELPPTQTDA